MFLCDTRPSTAGLLSSKEIEIAFQLELNSPAVYPQPNKV